MAQGIGIATEFPENPLYFKQFDVEEMVTIPEEKPDIEEVISVMVDVEIVSKKIVDTPCIKSYEGQQLSGKKLILEVKLIQKVKYIAADEEQSVHAAHFEKTARSVFVVIPQEVGGVKVESLLNFDRIVVNPYVEHIYINQIDERTIFKNITLMVDVVFV